MHFLVSIMLTAILYPFFGSLAFLVFLTSFLIDTDHYLVYVIKMRSFNPFKANRYFDNNFEDVFCIFHTVEFFLIIVLGAVFFGVAGKILLFGLVVHHVMDFYNGYKLDRLNAKTKSIFLYIMRRLK